MDLTLHMAPFPSSGTVARLALDRKVHLDMVGCRCEGERETGGWAG